MTSVPFAITALFVFSAVFNFGTSALMFYLRTRSGTKEYTKSQLWGITILAWLFLLNGLARCRTCCSRYSSRGQTLTLPTLTWP